MRDWVVPNLSDAGYLISFSVELQPRPSEMQILTVCEGIVNQCDSNDDKPRAMALAQNK